MKNHEIRAWNWLLGAVLGISVLRGIRYPGTWAYTHYLFNYDHGFVKRAFIGSFIKSLNIEQLRSYPAFFWISLLLLFLNIGLIYILISDVIQNGDRLIAMGMLVFAASPAVAYLAHISGYFDHLGLLATLISLKIDHPVKKMLFLIPSLGIAVISNEVNLILFFPTALMSVILYMKTGKNKTWFIFMFFVLFFVILGVGMSNARLEKKDALAMYQELRSFNDPLLRQDAFEVLYSSGSANIENTIKKWAYPSMIQNAFNSLVVAVPIFVGLSYIIVLTLKKLNKTQWFIIAFLVASMSPVSLYMIAYDIDRWNMLTITSGFVLLYCVWMFAKNNEVRVDIPEMNYSPIFYLLLYWSAVSQVTLFDGYVFSHPPFPDHQQFILDVLSGRITLP